MKKLQKTLSSPPNKDKLSLKNSEVINEMIARKLLQKLVISLDQPFRYPGEIECALGPAREFLSLTEE